MSTSFNRSVEAALSDDPAALAAYKVFMAEYEQEEQRWQREAAEEKRVMKWLQSAKSPSH